MDPVQLMKSIGMDEGCIKELLFHAKSTDLKLPHTGYISLEDLVSEGITVFLRVKKKYKGDKNDKKHIRGFFRYCLKNHFKDLIRKIYRQVNLTDIEDNKLSLIPTRSSFSVTTALENLPRLEREYVEYFVTIDQAMKSRSRAKTRKMVAQVMKLTPSKEKTIRKSIKALLSTS